MAVKGKLLDTHSVFPGFEGIEFFSYKDAKGKYGVAEVTTGLNVANEFATEDKAIVEAKQKLMSHGLEVTKKQISEFSQKAPPIPHESKLAVTTIPQYELPSGKTLKPGNWIKFGHGNPKNYYKATKIYANNKIHVEEQDAWGTKLQEYDMAISDDIVVATQPKMKEKTPPPTPNVNEKVLADINKVWLVAKQVSHVNYDTQDAVPNIKKLNKALQETFDTTPYIFRAVSDNSFHTSMNQVLTDHVLTGSSHSKGTTCCSISPWSSLGFGSYMFVLDKKKLVENSDKVKPIKYYNYHMSSAEPKTFQGKTAEHDDIYTAGYAQEMEVRAWHIHDPLSVIAEVWIHREHATEKEKWELIEELESKYPQLKGRVRVLNVYKDLKWPKGFAKSLRKYLEGMTWLK